MPRRIVVAVVAAVLLGVGGAGTALGAAGESFRGPGVAHPATWLGSYATFAGDPWAWCVDAGRGAPDPAYRWRATSVPDPTMSYLLTRHGTSRRAVDHAALSFLVHSSPKLPHDARNRLSSRVPVVRGMDLPARVAKLRTEARDQAGPYSVSVSVDLDDDRSGAVNLTVRTGSGRAAAGWPARLTLSGPARWADGAGSSRTLTTGSATRVLPVVATGAGVVRVAASVQLPADRVRLHTSGRAGVQRVVTVAPIRAVTATAEARQAPFAPRVLTRTSHAVLDGPGELTDRLTVTALPGSTWLPDHRVTVTSRLWGPFDDRPGEWTTPPVAVEWPGYYVWTEQIDADAQQRGWTGRFGLVDETSVVRWQPHVRTLTSAAKTEPGTELTDLLTVTGVRPGAHLEVVSRLWGPLPQQPEPAPEVPDGVPLAGDVRTTVTGDGQYRTPPIVVGEPGYYVWTETIEADEHHTGWASSFGQADETTLVQAAAAPPAPEPSTPQPAGPEPVPTTAASPEAPAAQPAEPQRPSRRTSANEVPQLPKTGAAAAAAAVLAVSLVAAGSALVWAGAGSRRRGRHVAG